MSASTQFWPDGARLAATVSLQFEAGGQPISGAPGPVTDPIQPGYPDLPQNSFYEYGVREGIPRLLDLFDKHHIKVTSFMVGEAVDQHPELARRTFGVEFTNPNLVTYAAAFGLPGFRVEQACELLPTLRRALDLDVPSLLEVPVDASANLQLSSGGLGGGG
jgi:thiamine pyrophosphate-dependent enzyme/polysaccharide deacetylase